MRRLRTKGWVFLQGFAPYVFAMFLQMEAVYLVSMSGLNASGTGNTAALAVFALLCWGVYGVWYAALRRAERKCISEPATEVQKPGRSATWMADSLRKLHRPYMFLVLAVSLQYTVELWHIIAGQFFPEKVKEYQALMETSGLGSGDAVWLVSVYTVILAPVAEELLFRGVTQGMFRRAGLGFWTANVLQAALFGIFHFNFIQGVYAFAVGLLFGYMVKCYDTLAAGITLHICFNLIGTYGAGILPMPAGSARLLCSVAGLAVTVGVLLYLGKADAHLAAGTQKRS